jgi:hypothetical protein
MKGSFPLRGKAGMGVGEASDRYPIPTLTLPLKGRETVSDIADRRKRPARGISKCVVTMWSRRKLRRTA